MELIAAPRRQLKTWSMWLLVAAGVFDLGVVLTHSLGDLHVMSVNTLAVVNASLAFVTGAVRFVAQNIPVTTEEKIDLVVAAAAQPMQPDEAPVAVHIDGVAVAPS
jgi:hypothetical protein